MNDQNKYIAQVEAHFETVLNCHKRIFLRQLQRPGGWEDQPPDVFWEDDNVSSFFKAESLVDIRLILLGIYSYRKVTSETACVWVSEGEILQCQIEVEQTNDADRILCIGAQKLHHNAKIEKSQSGKLTDFVRRTTPREPIRLGKKDFKATREFAISFNCRGIPELNTNQNSCSFSSCVN